MNSRLMKLAPVALASISLAAFVPALAADVKLPKAMVFSAYDTGTSGFNVAAAVAKMMKEKYGTDLQVLPAGNDIARLAPLRAGRAAASAMGTGAYFAQEGIFDFGAREWGPQALQTILSSVDCNAVSLGVARDTGVKEVKGLRGKRVGLIVGSPALNQQTLAVLAFGDLKQSDVKVVEFASYGALWKGLINNEVDAAFGTTITGPAKEAEASPRGVIWAPLPHRDVAGWERVKKVGPFLFPQAATCGAGVSREAPIELANVPYPIFVAYGSQPADLVYAMTKAMIAGYDIYKDAAAGAAGLAAARQTKKWAVPVHPGAVRALKEAGQWSDDQEAHNNALFKRQAVLAAAWLDYGKSNPPSDENAFRDGWLRVRAAALAKAGMSNMFDQQEAVAAAGQPPPQTQQQQVVIQTPPAFRPVQPSTAVAQTERRIALVIGNSRYKNVQMLPNPQRDATMVADALKRTGFAEVTLQTDLGKEALSGALQKFAKSARNADWAVVYYAGHGIEVGGVNYLIPIDATLETDRDITFEATPLSQALSAVGGANKLRLVVLDACRVNPFASRMKREATASRAITRGFAREEPDAGTLVVYAAKDGEVASDGDGNNSPFSTAFVQNLQKPGIEINRLFRLVRDDVMDATRRAQTPYTYGSLSGRDEFFFIGPK